jgi:hypothetical protein
VRAVYPRFSKIELLGFRISGPGLGNLLFIFSRAWIYAERYRCKFIWPTWTSIRIGPWLRHERDKRTYHGLFKHNDGYVYGISKYWALLTNPKVYTDERPVSHGIRIFNYQNAMKMSFDDLLEHQTMIKDWLFGMVTKKHRGFENHNFNKEINVHVRLGDFASPSDQKLDANFNNIAVSVKWFSEIITKLLELTNYQLCFNIFSDGTDEELRPLLELSNVTRLSFGSSIADILALSQSKLIIASGSSYSLWARYLGQSDCITYYKQLKCRTLVHRTQGFEIEISNADTLPADIIDIIKSKYQI